MTNITVSPGNTSSGLTLSSGENLYVYGSALDIIVSAGGADYVYAGGSAINTTLRLAGNEYVSSGGTAVSTTISNAGTQRVLSDGTASFTTISNGGSELVSSGGTTSFTTVSSGGGEFVYSGGTAISTTVSNSGSDRLINGGTASFTTVSNGGVEILFNHGTATSTTVDFDGEQAVSAGGVASDTTVNADGEQYLSTGASAVSATVYTVGLQDVVGGSASFTTLSGGEQTVSSGGKAVSTTVSSGGYQNVSSGGTATGTMVDSSGTQGINSGTAFFTTVSSGGTEIVSYGGTAISTTVSGGGYQVVSGGVASATSLAGGATQVVGYSGTAVGTRVNSGGGEFVSCGGATSFTTISSGGAELLTSGGSAVSTTADSGGYLIVLSGGMQTATSGAVVSTGVVVYQPGSGISYYPTVASDVILGSGAFEYILPGGTAISTTISGGATDEVYSGGITSFATVSAGGTEYVYSSGTAISTLVASDGGQEVASGGTASATILTYAALQNISAGGTAISTTLEGGGTETVFDGGSVSFTTVTSQGQDVISAGGLALNTTVDSGGEESVYGLASFTTVSNGGIQDLLGTGLAANTLVDSGGTQLVYGNAQAVSTTVDSGGVEGVFSGGVTSFTTVSNGDIEIVFSGGTAVSTTISAGGELIVLPGGHQFSTTGSIVSGGVVLYQPGSAVTYYAQVASGVTVSNDATEYVLSGGSAVSNTVNEQADQYVYSGGTTTSTTVNQYGNQTVLFSGIASDTTVNDAGYETVSGGGLAISTTVSGGGYETVSGGGLTISTTLSGGLEVLVGGVSSDTTADGGGTELLFSGATAVSATVNDGSYQIVSGGDLYSFYYSSYVYVYGGVTSDTIVNSGGVEDADDLSTAISTTVNNGGALVVSLTSLDAPAGTASFTTVNSGGVEVIAGGSATSTTVNLSGSIDFEDLAYASGGSAFVDASDVLSVTVGGTTETQQLAGSYYASEYFVLSAGTYGGTQVTLEGTPCYCRGTRILTDRGELAVEDLHIGDRLVTLSGAVRPLRWIGRRSYTGRFAASNRNVLPILIRRDALADGAPRCDLCVSPLHAMYLDGVLIPAAALVNAASVVQVEAVDEVAYFHLELETHDIILAEGAASETFVDDDSRGMFHNAGEYRVMYPDAARVPARFCAPRVEDGEALEVVRRRLAARAAGVRPSRTETLPLPLGASAAERTKAAARSRRARCLGTTLASAPPPTLGSLRDPSPQEEREKNAVAQPHAPAATDRPSAQPGNLQGHIDHVGRGRIAGWARDVAAPGHPVRLRILDNDVAIGEAVADLYRADLQRRDIGDGRYGFELTIEGGLSPLLRHVIRVRRMSDGQDLPNSPWMMEAAPLTLPAPAVDGTRGIPLHGQLDLATRERIAGWARNGLATQGPAIQRPAILDLATPGTDPRTPMALQILDNGLPIARVLANRAREDLAAAGIGDGRYGFDIIIPGGLSPLARHVIQVRREADGAELPGSPAVIEAARGFDAGLRQAIASAVAAAGPGDNQERMLSFMLAQADRLLQQRADAEGRRVERLAWRQYQRRWGSLTDNARSDLSLDVPLQQPPGLQPPGHEPRAGVPGGRSADGSGSSPPRIPGSAPGTAPGDASWDVLAGTPVDTAVAADPVRRALVIDERIPVAGRDAGSQAILSHMRALQRLGYEVSFVAADEMAHAELAPDEAAPSQASAAQASAALGAAGVTRCGAPFYTSAEDLLRRQAECFDVVYLHRASIATRYLALARRYMPRARILYGVADLHHVRLERQAAIEARPELLAASRRARLEECVAAWSADAVITHSADEAELLRRVVPEASVYRVPWEVPGKVPPGAGAVAPTVSDGAVGVVADAAAGQRVDQVAPAAAATRFAARRGVAFIGNYAHTPNVDAARWLVDDVMPLVRQADPTIECLLVGSDMPEVVWRLAGPGVITLGHVEDLGRVFQRVRLTVAPLRYGAGVKGKVLESLAAGVPCVMTPIAAEGLGLPASLRALVGEDPVQLAALILCLHGDAKVHRTAVEAGQALIRANHNAAVVTAALQAAIEGWAHEPQSDAHSLELPSDEAGKACVARTTDRPRAATGQRHGRARPGSA